MDTDPEELPASPTLEEMQLQLLLVSALNNPERFEETFPDGGLKDYVRNRAIAHIRRTNSTETNPLA